MMMVIWSDGGGDDGGDVDDGDNDSGDHDGDHDDGDDNFLFHFIQCEFWTLYIPRVA